VPWDIRDNHARENQPNAQIDTLISRRHSCRLGVRGFVARKLQHRSCHLRFSYRDKRRQQGWIGLVCTALYPIRLAILAKKRAGEVANGRDPVRGAEATRRSRSWQKLTDATRYTRSLRFSAGIWFVDRTCCVVLTSREGRSCVTSVPRIGTKSSTTFQRSDIKNHSHEMQRTTDLESIRQH